jgi:hypothetical protein
MFSTLDSERNSFHILNELSRLKRCLQCFGRATNQSAPRPRLAHPIRTPVRETPLGAHRAVAEVGLLDRLANTVDEIDPRLLEAYAGFWEGDGLSGAETQSEMLRGVAFDWAPQTASEFVSEFISKMTSGT